MATFPPVRPRRSPLPCAGLPLVLRVVGSILVQGSASHHISLVYAVSSHTPAQVLRAHEGPCGLSSPEWSDTRRRIGASFTRTSQAFARFNPEIRTSAAELSEHGVRCPRPRVRRVVINPLPHLT